MDTLSSPSERADAGLRSEAAVIIFSGVFAPSIGGAGVVPAALAKASPDRITILTCEEPGAQPPAAGYAAFDAGLPFRVLRTASPFIAGFPIRLPPGKLRGVLNLLYNKYVVRPKVSRELRAMLRSRPFDVACFNTIGHCFWMPALLREINPQVKIVVYSHGEEWGDLMRDRAGQRMFPTVLGADAVVAVSTFTAGRVVEAGIAEERVHVVKNGVDLKVFYPGAPRPDLLDRFEIKGRSTILCLARLDERKGQDKLIGAMPSILARVPNSVLVLVGGGADEARLRALVRSLGLTDDVIFAGVASDEDVVGWYRTADLYAMPNRTTADGDTEGFGLVFLEAGACGLPVIGGRAGGVPDAIVEGETGFLVDGTSTEEIAGACVRLLLDAELRASMGHKGMEHAARCSWENKAAEFLRICDGVVKAAPR